MLKDILNKLESDLTTIECSCGSKLQFIEDKNSYKHPIRCRSCGEFYKFPKQAEAQPEKVKSTWIDEMNQDGRIQTIPAWKRLPKQETKEPEKTCTLEKKQLVFELNNIEFNLLPSQTDDKKLTCSLLNFPQYLPEFARTNDNFDLALAMYKNGCKVTIICELE